MTLRDLIYKLRNVRKGVISFKNHLNLTIQQLSIYITIIKIFFSYQGDKSWTVLAHPTPAM